MDQLDQTLLRTLASLKAFNFWHIAYIGRELDQLSIDKANRILWHEEKPKSDETFKRLIDLCRRGWILPWRSCSPDHILTSPMGKSTVRKRDTFYILGKNGRKFLKEKMGIESHPLPADELYYYALPLGCWLTASTCALALESIGAKLVPLNEVWTNDDGIPKPAFTPDFVVVQDDPIAFYICASPFVSMSEYFVAHVGRSLKFMHPNSKAVILTRTQVSFTRIGQAISRATYLGENREKIFVCDLHRFKAYHLSKKLDSLEFYNADCEAVQLLKKPVSTSGVPDQPLGIARFGSSSSLQPVQSLC